MELPIKKGKIKELQGIDTVYFSNLIIPMICEDELYLISSV